MKTQIALRLDRALVEAAKREAGRQNRSLANLIENVLAESLMAVPGDVPILSVVDDDLDGAEALDDDGNTDPEATDRFRHLISVARIERR